MLNAIEYATKQADGSYKGTLRTVSIKAEVDILLNVLKIANSQPDLCVAIEGINISAG
jgi:uncharacterized protein (DUF736 family)